MDAFCGSWKLFSRENYGEYLAAIGVNEEQIKVAQIVLPTITFYKDVDFVVLRTRTSIHTGEIWFRLGESFFEVTKDGRECTNVVTLEDKKLVHEQTWDHKKSILTYEVNGDHLTKTLTFGNTSAVLTYHKL